MELKSWIRIDSNNSGHSARTLSCEKNCRGILYSSIVAFAVIMITSKKDCYHLGIVTVLKTQGLISEPWLLRLGME